MEPRTPEERFKSAENGFNTVAEHHAHFAEELEAQQVRHDREIAEIRELQNAMAAGMIRLQEAQETTSRGLDEGMKEWRLGMEDLRDAQRDYSGEASRAH